ncbi:Holliday junction resolvase [Quillaja saponaria]|uniref:Holliday junction resolvase n=1 Tax=Quillaja saponaria TaxID=32244 RepID=A0AAD7QE70_QUISA|nr:Holliday junction resolvase [Quillaja saponaria]
MTQFLTLGIKASMWCGKHLKMTLMSIQESQEEEHSSLFFQLLLDMLRFAAASFSALAKHPVSDDKVSMDIVENFILELLNLTKISISEIKRIQTAGSEALKVIRIGIEAAIKLCEVYSESVNWEISNGKPMNVENPNNDDHVINITKCMIEKVSDIGVLAANDGGSSVAILNVSWKGVVTLLQIGKGRLALKVNVADIIVTLLLLVTEPLRCAAETWSSSLKDTISVTEAKRILVPVKFYLINAVKICSLYPCQAFMVYRKIILCVVIITTFKIGLSNDIFLRTACEVITELLEQTSFDLFKSLLNSDELKVEQKLEILDWLFTDKGEFNSSPSCPSITGCSLSSVSKVFLVGCEDMSKARTLLIGQLISFLNFLRYSVELNEDVKVGIARKLGWCLDIIVDEDVYSSILVLQFPVLYGVGKTTELVWHSLFSSVLHAFKTFIIAVSSSIAWGELESFLLENFFHPHFICSEIIMDLWCFMLRYSEAGVGNCIIDKLCSLLKLLASSESVLLPNSSLRKMARSICILLSTGAQSLVDQVYMSVVGDGRYQLSSITCLALFMEGFPLNLLSEKMKNAATRRFITGFFDFVETFDEKSTIACSSGLFGFPVFALSASLQSLKVGLSSTDASALKFLVLVIRSYKFSMDEAIKDHYRKLLSEMLGIISTMNHLYRCGEIEEVILELESLFISGPVATDTLLYKCKPDLALFMAGLSHMDMSERDESPKNCAVWELYHMLLKEQHWAFAHLAITAFGYFAARTNCNQLWRFVPQDAALSYDLISGKEADTDRFMSELKTFLGKEMALLTITPSSQQLELLEQEGMELKEIVRKFSNSINAEAVACQSMDVDSEKQSNRKRKLPDGISRGVELLHSGLKIIGDGLSEWQLNQFESTELHEIFLTHFSCLKDAVTHFVGLARTS